LGAFISSYVRLTRFKTRFNFLVVSVIKRY